MSEEEEFKLLLKESRRSSDYNAFGSLLEYVSKDPKKYAGDVLVLAAELTKRKAMSSSEEGAKEIASAFMNLYNIYKEYASEETLEKVREILKTI
ncbi:MAG: hypothetical protein ACP5RF_03075 [Candidatus Micrarchaeia archaeon]